MKKEVAISLLVGFGVGLVITFALYLNRNSFKSYYQIISPISEIKETTPSISQSAHTLSIVSPIDQSISSDSKIKVSGVTSPSSWVTIVTEKGEKVILADKKGNFETDVILISGENEIKVISISESQEQVSKTVTVVYSTAEI